MGGNGSAAYGAEIKIRYRRLLGGERLYIDAPSGAALGFYDCRSRELRLSDHTSFEAVATALVRFLVAS
ncbi:MAG: hypothetical protein QOH90_1962 [Actinomycetota bacterium]|jgi:hypothetical protein|nr:hypothetical protein [Actinomycetota bacterium]